MLRQFLHKNFIVFSLLLIFPFTVQGQVVDVGICRDIDDRLARFDCYEGLEEPTPSVNVSDLPKLKDSVVITPVSKTHPIKNPTVTTDEITTDVNSFGKSFSPELQHGEEGIELVDTITALELRGNNIWRITLSSGQIWKQRVAKRYRLKVGNTVRVYPSNWGSNYRLSSEHLSGFIQIERIDNN